MKYLFIPISLILVFQVNWVDKCDRLYGQGKEYNQNITQKCQYYWNQKTESEKLYFNK